MSEEKNIYEQLRKIITLKIYNNNGSRIIEPKNKSEKSKNIFNFTKKGIVEEKSDYILVDIELVEVPAKKIFRYVKLSLNISEDFKNDLLENKELDPENFLESEIAFAIVDSMRSISNPDKLIKFILDEENTGKWDEVISKMTERQKLEIIKAFEDVNPILVDSQKKIEMTMNNILKMISEEKEKMKESQEKI